MWKHDNSRPSATASRPHVFLESSRRDATESAWATAIDDVLPFRRRRRRRRRHLDRTGVIDSTERRVRLESSKKAPWGTGGVGRRMAGAFGQYAQPCLPGWLHGYRSPSWSLDRLQLTGKQAASKFASIMPTRPLTNYFCWWSTCILSRRRPPPRHK